MDGRHLTAVILCLMCLTCAGVSQAQKYKGQDVSPQSLVSCTCMPSDKCKWDDPVEHSTEHSNDQHYEVFILRDEGDEFLKSKCKHYLDRCCYRSNLVVLTPPPTCGQRNTEGVGITIMGDTDHKANYGEFPWMVLVFAGITTKILQCGGSIIHPQVVLTGAHCVKGKKDLYVRAGEWNTHTKDELFATQDRAVKQVIIHEGYNAGGLLNDVALLILDKPVEPNPVVGTLCLPQQGELMDGRHCVVSGWGKDIFGKEGKYQVILKRVEQPIVRREPCQEALRKTRLGQRFRLHESFICAGGQAGEDACTGDGGGPLACPSKDDPKTYVQAGIVSWGIGCGSTTPAVYVNVPHFRTWIDNKMAALGFTIPTL